MDDDMLVCPYDPSHSIHALRMPRHLLKCRKNHPSVEMAVCPFNGFHEVPTPELRYHMEHCPDKALLDRDMQFDYGRTRVKGFTDLPKSRSNNLQNDDDELWESELLEDSSSFQRNRQRSRPRHTEDNRLRLPNREGIAARLANSLIAVENSTNQTNQAAPHGLPAHKERSWFQAQNRMEQATEANYFHEDSRFHESSSLQSNQVFHNSSQHVGQSMQMSLQRQQLASSSEPERLSSANIANSVNNSLIQSKKSDDNKLIPTINNKVLPRSESTSSTDQGDFLPASNCRNTLSGPEGILPALKYEAFFLGRGRAMPSFTSKSSLDQKSVGRETAINSSLAAAQSKRLMHLAYSLGRGRGLNRTSNPA